MNAVELHEYRRKHVPVFNDNKMKLGVFGTNVSERSVPVRAERNPEGEACPELVEGSEQERPRHK